MHDMTQHRRLAGIGLGLLLGGMGAASAAPSVYEVRHHFEATPVVSGAVLGSLAPTLGRDGKLYGLKLKDMGTLSGSVWRRSTCVLYRHDPASGVHEELGSIEANGGGLAATRISDSGSRCSAPVEDEQGEISLGEYIVSAENEEAAASCMAANISYHVTEMEDDG